ncbi:MAG: hypothetical protein GXO04_05345 [Aquificae bacterium]|nr:hypothetical protein [Aquificota bacterium]
MLRIWDELDRVENLFLELLDDPYKKDVLLYLICYCQLVRRWGDYEVGLESLMSCAEKPYKLIPGSWQDILLELGILYVKDKNGKVYTGKDILTLQSPKDMKVGISPEYREDFYKFYAKLLKYWSVLSSKKTFGGVSTPEGSAHLLALTFNEKLFREAGYYARLLSMRFPREKLFFDALALLSEFYATKPRDTQRLKRAIVLLRELPPVYYAVNTEKLRKDSERLLKDLKKGRLNYIKIEFIRDGKRRGGLLRRLWNFIRSLGGRRWSSTSSETDYYSFIELFLRKPRKQMTPS